MNRSHMLVAAVFAAIVVSLLPYSAQGAESRAWFDDLTSPLQATPEEMGPLIRFASALLLSGTAEAEQRELPADLKEDRNLRMVFLSVSNGRTRARVFPGFGKGVIEAVLQAAGRARDDRADRHGQQWLKLDIVQDVRILRNVELFRSLSFDESLSGIALDRRSGIAFLPEELSLFSGAGKGHGLIPEQLLKKAQGNAGHTAESAPPAAGTLTMYRFRTTSVFTDGISCFPLYRGHRMFADVSKEEVLSAARLGGDYLSLAVSREGRFEYTYEPGADDVLDDYNIVRHAGTIYAMLELYEVTRDYELLHACERAIAYLLRQAHPCPRVSENATCVVEKGYTKLGANALAALALAKYTSVTLDRAYVPVLLELGNALRSFQAENGEFFIQKLSYPEGAVSGYASDYYPGEALFALTRIYGIDPKEIWLDAAEKGARYLIRHGRWPWTWSISHDHWLLYALNELYRLRPNASYLDHALRISHAIMGSQNRTADYPDWRGGYFDFPGSTPAATRTEGLSAAYLLARDFNKPRDAQAMLEAVRLGVSFGLQTQFRPESAMYLDYPARALGGFHESLTDYTVRIDYVQHNLSALLGYYRILETMRK